MRETGGPSHAERLHLYPPDRGLVPRKLAGADLDGSTIKLNPPCARERET